MLRTLVEGRPIMSVEYCLLVPVLHFRPFSLPLPRELCFTRLNLSVFLSSVGMRDPSFGVKI